VGAAPSGWRLVVVHGERGPTRLLGMLLGGEKKRKGREGKGREGKGTGHGGRRDAVRVEKRLLSVQ